MSNSIKSFKTVGIVDRVVADFQDNVEVVLQPVLSSSIIDGILLKGVALLSASTTEVNHKLGRKPLGWIVVRQRADSRIWDAQDTNTKSDRTLTLSCSADVTVDLWIF